MAKQVSLIISGIREKDAEPWRRVSPLFEVLVSIGGGGMMRLDVVTKLRASCL